jgi:hypothetical protein
MSFTILLKAQPKLLAVDISYFSAILCRHTSENEKELTDVIKAKKRRTFSF